MLRWSLFTVKTTPFIQFTFSVFWHYFIVFIIFYLLSFLFSICIFIFFCYWSVKVLILFSADFSISISFTAKTSQLGFSVRRILKKMVTFLFFTFFSAFFLKKCKLFYLNCFLNLLFFGCFSLYRNIEIV